MKRMKMTRQKEITFEEGCNLYLNNCKERNLREGTINHYRQSYLNFYKFFDKEMTLSDFSKKHYSDYVLHLRKTLSNDVSINAYLRDMITTMHFLMNEGYVEPFKMKAIKVDKPNIETYSEEELRKLLEKPNLRSCSFTEYKCWVMTNFLFSTGVRQRSLNNIKIKDVDFENQVVHVNVTKNRKALIVPISKTMTRILEEYLKYRQHKSKEEYLFCNVYGEQLTKGNSYHRLSEYNKKRGVETTGIHRYRHTFAKQWILNGGNVVTLSKILGHSSLQITQNYINLLVSDMGKEVEEINLIDKFSKKKRITF